MVSAGKLNFICSDEGQLHQTFPKGSVLGPHKSPVLFVPQVLEEGTEKAFHSSAGQPSWRPPRAHSKAGRNGLY